MNFSKAPSIELNNIDRSYVSLHAGTLSCLPIATIFASFVEGVTPVKTVNFEKYPSIATRGPAIGFTTVPINCT